MLEYLTVTDAAVAITAVVLWLTVIDIAVLVNAASWAATKWLINRIREM